MKKIIPLTLLFLMIFYFSWAEEKINYTDYSTLDGIYPEEELTASNHDQKIKEAGKCFVAYLIPNGENVEGGIEFLDALQERYEKKGVKFFRAYIKELTQRQRNKIIKLNEKDYFPTIFYYENGKYRDGIRGPGGRNNPHFVEDLKFLIGIFDKLI